MTLLDSYIASYVERGITLDEFQIEACQALDAGRDVLVCAPTGSGKTVVAHYGIELARTRGKKCIYTAPIKALSNQKYTELSERLGADAVGLLTGDSSINRDAPILIVTTEVLRNMLLHASDDIADVAYVVLDEVHYLADKDRGPVWEEIILSLPSHTRLISLSATVSNTDELMGWLQSIRGRTTLVESHTRPVPLKQHVAIRRKIYPLYDDDTRQPSRSALNALDRIDERIRRVGPKERNNTIRLLESRDMLPAIEFIFSRKGCDKAVESLLHIGVCLTNDRERRDIERELDVIRASLSASDRRAIGFDTRAAAMLNGYAAHHAGVFPALKELTERLMEAGLLKLVYATGTLALGVDMPVRTVVLEDTQRWDGSGFVNLTGREYTQLIGRAGRRGRDTVGHAVILGTTHLDPYLLADLGSGDVEPLISAFQPSYNTVVNLLARMDYQAARALVSRSFAQYQRNSDLAQIEARIAKIDTAAENMLTQIECDRGDVAEYLQLRTNAPRAKKSARRRAKERYRRRIAASFRLAHNGHVYAYAIDGDVTYGLMLSGNAKKIRVVDWNANMYWLRMDELASELRDVGSVEIPHGMSLRTASTRERIADDIIDMVLERVELGVDRDLTRSWDRFAEPEDAPYMHHPCHTCPDMTAHIEQGREYTSMLSHKADLEAQAREYTDSAGRDFDSTVGVLADMGLLQRKDSEITLGTGAPILQNLHLESDLLLYVCLSTLPAHSLSAEECAGWASQFLADDRLGTHMPSSPALRALTLSAQNEADFLRVLESQWGIERTPDVTPGCVDSFIMWAQGAPLEDCLSASRMSAGDFITAARRLVDVLGQIAAATRDTWIGPIAAQARNLVRRGELE